MKIADAKYDDCPTCGTRKRLRDEVHGCDSCRKVLDFNKPDIDYHSVTVFGESVNQDYILCSMKCFVRWLKAFKPASDYRFMSLPLFSGKPLLSELKKSLK